MKKRIVSLLLAVVMVLGMIPMTVLAEETACDHASATVSATYNGDKTHTTVKTCDSCGEAVANSAAAQVINFKEDVADAAAACADAWAGAKVATHYNRNIGGYEDIDGIWVGNQVDADENAAAQTVLNWIADNTDWAIDGDTSAFTADYKKYTLSKDDSTVWGVRMYNLVCCNGGNASTHKLLIDAPAAGTYDLVLTTLNENGSDNYCGGSIGGKFDIKVNGTTVASAVSFQGQMEQNTVTVQNVYLNEGSNSLHFYCCESYTGSTADGYTEGGINLIELQLQPIGGITTACTDEDGDGVCDVCEATICDHAEAKTVAVSNGDKTHTVKAVCTTCGAEVANVDAATVIDFKADVAAAAAACSDVWAASKTATHYNRNIGGYEDIDGIWAGFQATTEENAAAEAVLDWLETNAGWCMDDELDAAGANYKKYVLSQDDSTVWGLRMYNYVSCNGGSASTHKLAVKVDAAGTYDLVIDTLNENGYDNYCGGSIGGKFDVIVNGNTVASAVNFHGDMEEATVTIEDVELNAGVNTIHFYCVQAYNGSTTDGYNEGGINLIEMQMIPTEPVVESCADSNGDGECDDCGTNVCEHATTTVTKTDNGNKTHTVKAVCAVCGETVANMDAATVIDFKEDVAAAAAACPEAWAASKTATHYNRSIGGYEDIDGIWIGNGTTDEEKAASQTVLDWIAANAKWSVRNTPSDLQADYKKVTLSKDDSTVWGVRMYNYVSCNGGNASTHKLNVVVDAAGTYDLTITTLNENGSDNYCGGSIGGKFDIKVNDVVVAEAVSFQGNNEENTVTIKNVPLNAGSNKLYFYCCEAYNGSTTDGYNEGGINLIELVMAPVGEVTVACADNNADGKCDDCGAFICEHTDVTYTNVDNGDKTHTINAVCAACGETVANKQNAVTMDFMATAKAMAELDAWDVLETATLHTGYDANGAVFTPQEGIKVMNASMTDEQTAAATELLEWVEDNTAWGVDENGATIKALAKRFIFNSTDSVNWGLRLLTAYVDEKNTGSQTYFKVNVPAAGIYDIELSTFLERGTTNYAGACAGGTIDVYVLPAGQDLTVVDGAIVQTPVLDNYSLAGDSVVDTVVIEGITMDKGENRIVIDIVADKNGNPTVGDSAINLRYIEFAPVGEVTIDCFDDNADGKCDTCGGTVSACAHESVTKSYIDKGDGTHDISTVCDNCGAIVVTNDAEGESIGVDMMALMQQASQQSFWSKLPDSDVDGIKFIGSASEAEWNQMTTSALLAAKDMYDWLAENSVFNIEIDQDWHDMDGGLIYKRAFLNANADAPYGVRFDTMYFSETDSNASKLIGYVTAPKAGQYTFDLDVFNELDLDAEIYKVNGSEAGGHANIYVNDVLIYENYHFSSTDASKQLMLDLGAVDLVEGQNTLVIDMISDYFGSDVEGNSARRAINLRGIYFEEILPYNVAKGYDATIALDDYLAFDETISASNNTVTSSAPAIATASIDAAGNLVVEGLAEGTATVTVSGAAGELFDVVVNVTTVVNEACVDEDGDGYCDGCEAEVETEPEVPEIEKFDIAGVNMTLGNELELNIMLTKATVDAYGEDLNVTVIHHEYVDGDTEYTFKMSELPLYGGGRYYKASIRVAAAQMTDLVDVVVTDSEGNVYSNEFTTSVLTYVTNNLDKQTAKVKTLLVDMVNYGAAAQDQFTYRQDLYANSNLTDAQKALATGDVTCTDIRVKGTNYVGSNLSLQDCILLNFMFTGVADDVRETMYATVSFTGVLGNEVNVRVPVEKLMTRYAGVAVNQIVLADAVTPVTVTLYNADGSVYGYATDSVESYNARQNPNGDNALYTNIMKFAASALAYKQ